MLFSSGGYVKHRITDRNETEVKAKQMASLALEKLSIQAALHAQDPDAHRDKYMSVAQLRDDVLRDEFSAGRRKKLWEKVQKKVEGNSNVRPMVREGRTGDVGRVWEWVGAVGILEAPPSGSSRRKSGRANLTSDFIGEDSSMVVSEIRGPKRDDFKTAKWEESRPYF